MITIKYKDYYQIGEDVNDSLSKKYHNDWSQKSFTIFIRFKTNFKGIKKQSFENKTACVIGKTGKHFGLMILDNIYKFDFWTNYNGEEFYNEVPVTILDDKIDYLNIFISHDEENKIIELFLYDEKNDKKLLNSTRYKGELIDYSYSPTFLGCASNNDEEYQYPHHYLWSGIISYLKVIDEYINNEELVDLVYFDISDVSNFKNEKAYFIFDGIRKTETSIFDLSNNNNHARLKKI
jgi:hypothetical protein